MFSTPETSVHVLDKNREITPLEREEGYGGKTLWWTTTLPTAAFEDKHQSGSYLVVLSAHLQSFRCSVSDRWFRD